jgi:hypothetical protein
MFYGAWNNNGIAGGAYIEKWIKVILSVQKEK